MTTRPQGWCCIPKTLVVSHPGVPCPDATASPGQAGGAPCRHPKNCYSTRMRMTSGGSLSASACTKKADGITSLRRLTTRRLHLSHDWRQEFVEEPPRVGFEHCFATTAPPE